MEAVQPVEQSRLTTATSAGSNSLANYSPLVVTSVLLLHIAIHDGSPSPWVEWIDLIASILVAAAAWWFFRMVRGAGKASANEQHRAPSRNATGPATPATHVVPGAPSSQLTTHALPSAIEVVFLVLFGLLPYAVDIVLRQFVAHGNPLEIQLTLSIRNLMFGLIVLPSSSTGRLAIFTSLFLAIYGALVTVSVATNVLLAAYALFGLWWLMGNYWQRISAHFPDESTTEIPYFARVGAIVLVLFCLGGGALAFQFDAVTSAIAGFMPSSGGTGGNNDPFARGGVGDGDQMVAAKDDASSFGPIESELFLESKQPTLYDMYIDNYDPPKPIRRRGTQRAIPLSAKENQRQNHSKLAKNRKASREFSAIRRESADRKRQKLEDLQSKAMVYVAGRTPLHLGLTIFDHWDGHKLSQQGEFPEPELLLRMDAAERNWAIWQQPPPSECFSEPERHLLKIINLASPTIPSPPNMMGTHIDKLDKATYFRWDHGMLQWGGGGIPSLTVLHVKSRPLRRDRLDGLILERDTLTESSAADAGLNFAPRLQQLAETWTEDAASDWERVERICQRLRTFDHDSDVHVPDETDDAVEYFLFESKGGPDYLFATSAAVLLRSLGYQTRVISGLYADPKNYDRLAKSTGVFANDVHFWTEVQTKDGAWVAVEPTPGYKVLYAKQTLFEAIAYGVSGVIQQIVAHPIACLLTLLTIAATVLCRSRLFSLAATTWWRVRLNTSPRKQVLNSVLLLQRLTTRKKSGRQTGQTLDQWIASLGDTLHDSAAIAEFRSLVAWACYASSDRPALATAPVRQICVDSVKLLKERV